VLVIGRRSERVPRAAASVAAADEPSRATPAATRLQQEGRQWRPCRRWSPATLIKSAGGLARRAGPPEAARRSRPLLVVIPPPGGADRGGHPGQPPSPRMRFWWCGLTAT
jgi:hypothetical protein